MTTLTEPLITIEQIYQLLSKTDSNVVWDILRQCGTFYEWDHYPDTDVYDRETCGQYYYHAHPQDDGSRWEEHGHFHIFLRKDGIPEHCQPSIRRDDDTENTDDLCHLIAISMDTTGQPKRLFTTNRWVTGETWYNADAVCEMLPRFAIHHAFPSWPTNLWLNAMLTQYQTEIQALIHERDHVVNAWQEQHPDQVAFEDRRLEITSYIDI